MKTNRILTLFTILAISFAFTSCVQDDDYTVPSSLGAEENATLQTLLNSATEVYIADVKAMYQGDAFIEQIENDIYVKGYVSSSDATGNFFKEFYLQDSPSDPTGALKIILNQVDTYNQFNQGREVYINLKGLVIGEERVGNGVITIGGGTESDQYGTTVTSLNENHVQNNVLRSTTTEILTPLTLGFADINNGHVGVLVSIENVEFADNLAGKRYFDPIQVYDTQRTMQACGGFDYSEFQLETSGFSTFKEELLPLGNGTITGVATKTFDGSSIVLALNSTDDVNFINARCSLFNIEDYEEIMSEDFQTSTNYDDLDTPGWTNFAEVGSAVWREREFSGNGYAEFSSYNSGDDSNIAWLVSPGIDLDAQESEFLNFKMAQHHLSSDDNTIEVFVSTDYDGTNVLDATWETISVSLPSQANSWYDFIDSGLVNLSSYSGTLYVAFKATGDGDDLTGGFQLDDFIVLGEIE